MKKFILSAALMLVSTFSFAQLNTTGIRYQANNRVKKVRMVVPDTVQAVALFKEQLSGLQEELAQKKLLLQNAQNLQTKLGKKVKEDVDIQTLQLIHEYVNPGKEFKAPKKIAKNMAGDITSYTEFIQNEVYDVERAIRLGWQGTEYPQKEYSTEIDNENYRGLYFGDSEMLDKFDFEYQIKGYEDKLSFDEDGTILKNDLFDKRGRLTYVASLLRTDTEVMNKIRSLIAAKNKKANLDEVAGCPYIIERVTKTQFKVIYLNSKTLKGSYAALVTYRAGKANTKTWTAALTAIPKNIPAVVK